jgi:hypothetical protein
LALVTGACGGGTTPKQPSGFPLLSTSRPLWCPVGSRGTFDARRLIGIRERDAKFLVYRHDCVISVLGRDGQARIPILAYFRPKGIRVVVNHGKVSGIVVMG